MFSIVSEYSAGPLRGGKSDSSSRFLYDLYIFDNFFQKEEPST